MKQNLKLLLVFSLLIGFVLPSFAQGQKLGHINSAELLSSLPNWQIAQQNLETYASQLQKKLTDEENLLLKEYEEYRQKVALGGEAPKNVEIKEQEFKDRGMALQQKRQDAQKSVADKEVELFQPIQLSLNEAIQKFMKEKSYAYIFDTAQGNIAIGPLGEDGTEDIKSMIVAAD